MRWFGHENSQIPETKVDIGKVGYLGLPCGVFCRKLKRSEVSRRFKMQSVICVVGFSRFFKARKGPVSSKALLGPANRF